MGNINFVSNANFPNYTDGQPSGYSIGIVQDCLPTALLARVSGTHATYAWVLKDSLGNTACSGNIIHNGTGSGLDSNEYEICADTLVAGNQYILTISKDGFSEVLTFEARNCDDFQGLIASYNCSTGLEVTCNGTCETIDIIKIEDATETVAYPFVSPVFLESGFYQIEAGGESVLVEVDCEAVYDITLSDCEAEGFPNLIVILNNVITSEEYTVEINTTDEVPVLVHSFTLQVSGVPETEGTALNSVGVLISEFDTPPIDEDVTYTLTVEHTSLNAKSFLGTFNATIADITEAIDTGNCTTNVDMGDSQDASVTIVGCTETGFELQVSTPNETNIPEIHYFLQDGVSVGFRADRETYAGTDNTRNLEIPAGSFGNCIDVDFSILLFVKGTNGATTTWYNLRVDSGLISASLAGCDWANNCSIS